MKHLVAMLNRADKTDRKEGRLAYLRYHDMMEALADHHGYPDVPRVTAAFVALSPNNSYYSNLRSLVSVLSGLNDGKENDEIKVSTYKHCRDRAISYLRGEEDFLKHAKGLKTRAFFHNVAYPMGTDHVTVDGHIYCVWRGVDLTMKEAKVSDREYREIEADIIALATAVGMVPNALQATLWFTRKRTRNIVYDAQGDLFHGAEDLWRTSIHPRDILPYA